MKTALITGGAGFIGSHLAERCLELGWQVTILDAMTDYYAVSLKRANLEAIRNRPGCKFVEADVRAVDLRPLVDGVRVVFHLAAQSGVRVSWDRFETTIRMNIEGTQRLLEAARDTGIDRFVMASSSSVYGDAQAFPTGEEVIPQPISPYGISKLAAEHLARVYWQTHRVPSVCLRYFTVYGPRQRPDMALNRLISSALAHRPFRVLGDGEQTRDFTYVSDAVEGTIAAAERGVPGGIYNIGGGTRRSMNSVFGDLEAIVGEPVEREYVAAESGDARNTSADMRRAKSELGFEPRADFVTGLTTQLEWQRELVTAR